jgi:tripartite-type tricarboxylate transporter receptor subunit TctC
MERVFLSQALSRVVRSIVGTVIGVALIGVAIGSAEAQNYPKGPLKFIYTFAAGSTADVAWRLITEAASKQLGQPIAYDNRAGAGGQIGFSEVMRANPDGYTIGIVSNVTGVMSTLIYPKKWNISSGKDFTPIILGFEYPLILVAKPSAPFKNLKELLAYGKQNPGKLSGGSAGIGSGPHLGLAALNSMGGINVTHVPYQGNAPAVTALLSGETDILWTDIAAKQHVEAGTMIPIGVASPKRWNLFPNVPTLEEAGLPGLFLQSWQGVAGPANLPQNVVSTLNVAYNKALSAVGNKLVADGWSVLGGTPSDLDARIKKDLIFYAPLVRDAKIVQ